MICIFRNCLRIELQRIRNLDRISSVRTEKKLRIIEIVKVVPLTCMSVGLYLVNGEWGIHTTNVNSAFVIVITYYNVK